MPTLGSFVEHCNISDSAYLGPYTDSWHYNLQSLRPWYPTIEGTLKKRIWSSRLILWQEQEDNIIQLDSGIRKPGDMLSEKIIFCEFSWSASLRKLFGAYLVNVDIKSTERKLE